MGNTNNSNEVATVFLVLALLIIVAVCVGGMASAGTRHDDIDELRKELVDNKLGKWTIDETTGKKAFESPIKMAQGE